MRRATVGQWLLIVVLTVGLVVLYVDNKRTRDCIANYMTRDQQNTQARASLQEEERGAFLVTLQQIFSTAATPAERKAAGDKYIDLVLKNNELRKQAPVLQVPTECD